LDSAKASGTASASAAPAPAAAMTSGTASIFGTVEIASQLAASAPVGATLFIYAKQPNVPGPPLAVLRVPVAHWPVSFTLSDENAMVPSRNLSSASSVQVEARISRSGDALPRSGDLVGSVSGVNPHAGGSVRISIDRKME